jgi:hypothetical protein
VDGESKEEGKERWNITRHPGGESEMIGKLSVGHDKSISGGTVGKS